MIFKKRILDWQDLFKFVLYRFSEMDSEIVNQTSTDIFIKSLYIRYNYGKKDAKNLLGDIFKLENEDQDSPAVQFMNKQVFLYDFISMRAYYKNPCCSPWPKLSKTIKKDTLKILAKKENKALLKNWEEFFQHVLKSCKKYRRRIDKI